MGSVADTFGCVADSLTAVDRGRRALAAGDWSAAQRAFEDGLAHGVPAADAVDGLGLSLWWQGRTDAGLEARGHAYTMLRRQGHFDRAGVIAAWLAREYRIVYRNGPVAGGWIARARSCVECAGDPATAGWVELAAAELSSDPAEGLDHLAAALRAGRGRNADLEIQSLARWGLRAVGAGDVDAGIAALDEAMTAATAGEGLDLQSVAEACCSLTDAVALLGDTGRLSSWGDVIRRLRSAYDFGPLQFGTPGVVGTLSSFCGACCGGVYLVTGSVDEAEQELLGAIDRLNATGQNSRCVHPVTRLAEVRIVQGRLDEASVLLLPYDDLPEAVGPAAMLDLELGDPASAEVRLRNGIAALATQQVAAIPLWLLLVETAIARADVVSAEAALTAVGAIVDRTRSDSLRARMALAQAQVTAHRGDSGAPQQLRVASRSLSRAGLPLLAARARLALSRALDGSDRPTAVAEARGALAAFDRLGARSDVDRAAAQLRTLGVRGRTGAKDPGRLTHREREVLRLVSEGLSNAEIAARLFISVKTAGNHVSSILMKLDLRSRTEAAAYAVLHLDRAVEMGKSPHADDRRLGDPARVNQLQRGRRP